jgi:hypothetical protein
VLCMSVTCRVAIADCVNTLPFAQPVNHLFIENSSCFNNPAIDRLYFHESRDWVSFSDLLLFGCA